MEEELTEKMHSEFTVDPETEIKHIVWSLLSFCNTMGTNPEEELRKYPIFTDGGMQITIEHIEKYKYSYYNLNGSIQRQIFEDYLFK